MKSFNNLYLLFLVLFIVGIAEVGLGQDYEIDDGTGSNFTTLTTGKIVCPHTVYTIRKSSGVTGGRHWVASDSDILIGGADGTVGGCANTQTVEFTGGAGLPRVIDISTRPGAGGGCSAVATQSFSFNVQPLAHPEFTPVTATGCVGQNLLLTPGCTDCATSGASYQWYENSTGSFLAVGSATSATYDVPSANIDAIALAGGTVDYRLQTTVVHGGGGSSITCIDNGTVTIDKEVTPSLSAITFNSGSASAYMCTDGATNLEVACTDCVGTTYAWEYKTGANSYAPIPAGFINGANDAATIALGGGGTPPVSGRYDLRVTATNNPSGCALTSGELLNQLEVRDLPGVEIFHNLGGAGFTASTSDDGEFICTGQELQLKPGLCTSTSYNPSYYAINQSSTTAPNVSQVGGAPIDYQSPCRIGATNFFQTLEWTVAYTGGTGNTMTTATSGLPVSVVGGGTLDVTNTTYTVNTPTTITNVVTLSNRNPGPATYTLRVTGANGCVNSDDITVTMQDATADFTYPSDQTGVVTDLSGTTIDGCEGTQVAIDAVCADCVVPSVHTWTTTGPTGLVATAADPLQTTGIVAGTTTYGVTVVGARGCIGKGTINLDHIPAPNLTAVAINSRLCSNEFMRLGVTGYNSTHSYEVYRGNPVTGGFSVFSCASGTCNANGAPITTNHRPITGTDYYLVASLPSGCTDTVSTGVVTINRAPNVGRPYAPSTICNDRPYVFSLYNYDHAITPAHIYTASISRTNSTWMGTGTFTTTTAISRQSYTLSADPNTDPGIDISMTVRNPTTNCRTELDLNQFAIIDCEDPVLQAEIRNNSPDISRSMGDIGQSYDYNYVCAGGTIELLVDMGRSTYSPTFLWSSGETTPNIIIATTNLTPDTVNRSVQVFDASGNLKITLSHQFYVSKSNIEYYPTDESFFNDTSICVNENLLSQVRCTGCKGDIRYRWNSSLPGTFQYNYITNNNQFDPYIIGPSTGSFTTELTVYHGENQHCRDVIDRTIGVNSLPVVDLRRRSDNSLITAANPLYLCVGESDSLIVNCSGCYNTDYQWNTGATTPSVYLNNQGAYYATVKNQNGCRSTSELAVVIEATDGFNSPAVANPSQICSGNDVVLEVAPCIGCSYQWIDVSSAAVIPSGQTHTTSDTGNYYAQVINAQGCYYNTAQVSVSEISLALPSISGTTDSICTGQYSTLSTSSGMGVQYQWHWNGGAGSTYTPIGGAIDSLYQAYNTGSYRVYVTYPNGCIEESPSFIINSASFTPNITNSGFVICRGETVDVSTSLYAGWEYQWFRNGILIPGAIGSIYSADSAGNYYAEVTNYNLCVEQTGVINLTSTSLSVPNATTSTPTVCPGEFGQLSVSLCSGCSYEWFNDDGISVAPNSTLGYNYNNVSVTDNYYAVITNNGCSENSDTVNVTINSVFTPAISSTSNIVCDGLDAQLFTQGCLGCSYTWLKDSLPALGAVNDTFHLVDDISETGNYQIAVDYPNGCSDTSAVLPIYDGSYNVLLEIDPGGSLNPVICNGVGKTLIATPDTILTGTYSYTLFLDNTPITGYSNVTSSTFSVNTAGVITTEVIDPLGCKAISNFVSLRAVDIVPTLSSRATSDPSSVPTTAICTPTGTAYLEVDVAPTCANCTYEWRKGGATIPYTGALTILSTTYTTDVGPLGAGLYIVNVTDDGCTASSNPVSIADAIGTLDSEANTTDTSICNGQSVTLEHAASAMNPSVNCPGCSFRWLGNLNPINGASNYQYVTSMPGVYNLEVTTANGCVDTSSMINIREVNPPDSFALDLTLIGDSISLGTGTPLASNGSPINLNFWLIPDSIRTDSLSGGDFGYFTNTSYSGALNCGGAQPCNPGLSGVDSNYFTPDDTLSGYHLITYHYNTQGCAFTSSSVLEVLPPAAISVTNLNPASVAYEACVGDTLVINTTNLNYPVDSVFAFDKDGIYQPLTLSNVVITSDTFGSSIRWNTTIYLTVPDSAYASYFRLEGIDTNAMPHIPSDTFTSFVLIHNTDLSFTGLPNMLCSNGEGLTLFGSPTGGAFSARVANNTAALGALISGAFVVDTLYPQQFSQVAYVDGSQYVDIYYSYRESYTNGSLCPNDDTVSIRKEVKDVRLTDVKFNTISISQEEELLTNLVYETTPYAARPNKQPLYTSTFSGSFTRPAGSPTEFLPVNAGVGRHALTYSIQSGDCINSVEDSITVVPAPTSIPIPDTICRNFGITAFAREISAFPYGPLTVLYPPNTAIATFTDEVNIISVTGLGVSAVNTTVGNESFIYDPTLVVGNNDVLTIEYGFYRQEDSLDVAGSPILFDSLEYVIASITMPIYIEDTVIVDIVDTIVSSFYCQENTLHLLAGSPSNNSFGGGIFTLFGGTNQYQFGDTLFNSVINPYDVNNLENATTTYDLVYTLNGAACQNSDTKSVTIGRGLNPAFATANGLDEFCDTDPNVLITHNVLPPDTAIWIVGGVPQPSYVFGPDPLIPGIHVVELRQLFTYIQATDTFVCSASAIDTFTIHALPALTMTPNGLDNDYCANDTIVDFVVGPAPGCPAYAVSGHILLDEKFNSGIPPSWNSTYNFGGKNWTGATSLPQGGTGGAAFIDTSQVLNDSWLITQTLNLVAGHTYRLTYMARAGELDPTCSGFCDASLVVAIGTAANPANMGTQLDFQPSINNDQTYVRYEKDHYHDPLAGFVTGPYNLGFRSTTAAFGRSLRLDNVRMRDMTLVDCSLDGIGYVTGPGVHNVLDSAYQFNPLAVPAGDIDVKYIYTDIRGCQDSLTYAITVDTTPIVSFTDLPSTYCENEPTLLITGSPLAGEFTSTMGTNLVPVGLAVLDTANFPVNYQTNTTGTDIVTYRFEDNNGCSETVHDTIVIVPLLDSVFISGSLDPFGYGHCVDADSTILGVSLFTGSLITNGIFYGPGVRNGAAGAGVALFYPDSAEIDMGHIGDVTIEYIYTTTTGCVDTTRSTTTVHALPDLTFMNLPDSLCLNTDSFQVAAINHVVTGSMGQIMYADTLINRGQFIARDTNGILLPNFIRLFDTLYPYTVDGYSQVNVTYNYSASAAFGLCSNTIYDSVRIDTIPEVYFQDLRPYYCENEPTSIFLAFPPFSVGSGYLLIDSTQIDSSFFWIDPGMMVGPGMTTAVYPTYYTFTDSRGCRGEAYDTFEVRPYPRITFDPLAQDTFCRQVGLYDLRQLLIGPIGGFFTDNLALTSIQDSFYLNLNSLAGPRLVTYNYIDSATQCQNQDSIWLYLFNSPEIDFTVYGGCAQMDITFDGVANNLVSGIDSLTRIEWDFEGNNNFVDIGLDTSPITIPDTTYRYTASGTYNVSLRVQNQGSCAAIITKPLIISPYYDLATDYFENFDTSAGDWYDDQPIGVTPSNVWTYETSLSSNYISNLDGFWVTMAAEPYYEVSQSAWVYSPCFDFEDSQRPMIALDLWRDVLPGIDGAVLEFYNNASNEWELVGNIDEGIDWYQSDFVLARPGNQLNSTFPSGWTGRSNGAESARLRLDQFKGQRDVRFRIAFATSSQTVIDSTSGTGYEGVAFDNVFIGERTRNVLVEHFDHVDYVNTNSLTSSVINQSVYNKIFNSWNGLDVILIQYQTEDQNLSDDPLFLANPADLGSRQYQYSAQPNNIYVDGRTIGDGLSESLDQSDLDYNMLQFPDFLIELDTPVTIVNGVLSVTGTVEALAAKDSTIAYTTRVAVIQDSFTYIGNSHMLSVFRKMLPDNAGIRKTNGWQVGEIQTIAQSLTLSSLGQQVPVNETQLEVVVFVQNADDRQREVYQAATTQDLNRYTGTTKLEDDIATEIFDLNVYPNPSSDLFNVKFDKALEGEYKWRLVDVTGRVLQTGMAGTGTEQFTINAQRLVDGAYFFIINSDDNRAYAQRKLIVIK